MKKDLYFMWLPIPTGNHEIYAHIKNIFFFNNYFQWIRNLFDENISFKF